MSKIAFVFPGQGSQSPGMGSEFYYNYNGAKEIFDLADKELDFSVSQLCFHDHEGQLNNTAYTQPALLTVSVACYQVLAEKGVNPDFVAGHSLGEYTGLVVGGALSLNTAVKLVHQRGVFMNEAVPAGKGAMAALLGLNKEDLEQICREACLESVVEIANYNCPGQIVISGLKEGVEHAGEIAKKRGAKRVFPLQVSGPFHSSLMAAAGVKLAGLLNEVEIQIPAIPVAMNVTGELVVDPEKIKSYLIRQVETAVRWEECVKNLMAAGVTTFIEVGPGKVLSGLIKKINSEVIVLNVEDKSSLDKTLATLKGGE